MYDRIFAGINDDGMFCVSCDDDAEHVSCPDKYITRDHSAPIPRVPVRPRAAGV